MQYTIEAGRALTSTWTDAGYNISLHGPNGFVRKFSGNASAAAAAAVSFREVGGATAPGTEAVVLSMQPVASALADVRGCSVSVEVRDNEYTHGGPWTFALSNTAAQGGEQQQQQQHRVQTASSGNWYDLTATTVLTCGGGSPSAATYSRRYMGKVETVHATSTDPAMAKGTPADAGSATHPTIPDAVRKLMQDGARATHPAAAKVEGGAGAVGRIVPDINDRGIGREPEVAQCHAGVPFPAVHQQVAVREDVHRASPARLRRRGLRGGRCEFVARR